MYFPNIVWDLGGKSNNSSLASYLAALCHFKQAKPVLGIIHLKS
jgi:hypothetical protein